MTVFFRNIKLFVLSGAVILSLTSFNKKGLNNRDLIDKIFAAVENVKTLRYNLECNERIKGKMQHTESKVKLQISPRKLYLYIKGIEVLWVQGQNNGNALVNPNSFPYINLNLELPSLKSVSIVMLPPLFHDNTPLIRQPF